MVGMASQYFITRKIIGQQRRLARRNHADKKTKKTANPINHIPSVATLSSALTSSFDFVFLCWALVLLVGVGGYSLLQRASMAPFTTLAFSFTMALLAGGSFTLLLKNSWPAKKITNSIIEGLLCAGALVSLLVSFGIIATLFTQSWYFFNAIPLTEFLFGTHWDPSSGSGNFGSVPLFMGTLVISVIAMLLAVPLGLFIAIYLNDYCPKKIAAVLKPLLELLAGVPAVVYGFFAILVVSPFIKNLFGLFGLSVPLENALATGLVMGIAITPIISSLSQDAIQAVPRELREASIGLGATNSETMVRVILPAASGGIFSAILIAISRAIGETMIVVMAAGLTAKLSINPLDSLTTATVQIVSLLTGDSSFGSPTTLSAFALGLVLFMITLFINGIAIKLNNRQVKKSNS